MSRVDGVGVEVNAIPRPDAQGVPYLVDYEGLEISATKPKPR